MLPQILILSPAKAQGRLARLRLHVLVIACTLHRLSSYSRVFRNSAIAIEPGDKATFDFSDSRKICSEDVAQSSTVKVLDP